MRGNDSDGNTTPDLPIAQGIWAFNFEATALAGAPAGQSAAGFTVFQSRAYNMIVDKP